MKIVSLVQHPMNIILPDVGEVLIQPSGVVAVVRALPQTSESKLVTEFGTFPVRAPRVEGTPADVYTKTGPKGAEVDGEFPAKRDGVVFLVNAMVLAAMRGTGRDDLFAPDTGETARRNEKNHVTGVYGLIPCA
jgi:hypothetical protein